MKKIVFFDIDGTLLIDHNKQLPESTKDAIKQLQDNGVYVAIATGRAPFMFESLRKELGIHSYISYNGQFVVFEDEIIYKNPLQKKSLQNVYDRAQGYEAPLVFMSEHTMKSTVEYSEHIETAMSSFSIPHPEYEKDFFLNNDIFQTLLYIAPEEEKAFSGVDEDIRFIRWHPVALDIVPANGSKANGIKQFIERAGFRMENVYAFGDGLNDIEMLRTVGTGVAMGNSHPDLFQYADKVTTDVEEDGIMNGLKELGLI